MSTKPDPQPNERDAVAYIGEMSSALAQLARQHRLAALTYLLELVQMEAENSKEMSAKTGVPAASVRSRATEPRSESSATRSGHQSAECGK